MLFRAAILAAGEGSRLAASGVATPKALVEVGGRPLIVGVADELVAAGAVELVALIHPAAAAAEALLAARHPDLPRQISIAETPSSFHSFQAVLPHLEGAPFLMSLVDSVFDPADLQRFVATMSARPDAVAGLAVTAHVADENPLWVRMDGSDGCAGVVEIGTAAAGSGWVTGGVYWFGIEVHRAARDAGARGIHRLRNFLAFLLERGDPVVGVRFGMMIDVDSGDDLRAARALEWPPAKRSA